MNILSNGSVFMFHWQFCREVSFFLGGLPFSRSSSGNDLHANYLATEKKKTTSFGTPKGGGLVREMGPRLFQGNLGLLFHPGSQKQEYLGW